MVNITIDTVIVENKNVKKYQSVIVETGTFALIRQLDY